MTVIGTHSLPIGGVELPGRQSYAPGRFVDLVPYARGAIVLYIVVEIDPVLRQGVYLQSLAQGFGLRLSEIECLLLHTPSVRHIFGHKPLKRIAAYLIHHLTLDEASHEVRF